MKKDSEIIRAFTLLTQLGASMAMCVILGVLAGKALDARFNSAPILLIICSLAGGAAAFKVMYDIAIKE